MKAGTHRHILQDGIMGGTTHGMIRGMTLGGVRGEAGTPRGTILGLTHGGAPVGDIGMVRQ